MLPSPQFWHSSEWVYYKIGRQWLVEYNPSWVKEVKSFIERCGFLIKDDCQQGNYYVCEVTEKTKIFNIKKLKNYSSITNICPNYLIKSAMLHYPKDKVYDTGRSGMFGGLPHGSP
jgi:hypothetical protein